MPSDHPLTTFDAIHPQQLVGQPFIAMVNKAKVARAVIDDYLERSGVQITPTQGADNPAMVMSLVASMRGMALIQRMWKICCPGRSSAARSPAMSRQSTSPSVTKKRTTLPS